MREKLQLRVSRAPTVIEILKQRRKPVVGRLGLTCLATLALLGRWQMQILAPSPAVVPACNPTRTGIACLRWACLLWACLLGAASAEPALQPLGGDTPVLAAAEDVAQDSPSFQDQSPEQDTPLLGDSLSPAANLTSPARASADNETWAKPTVWSSSGSERQQTTAGGAWRWVPLGMIPYIGPRTPDSLKDLGVGEPLPIGAGWRSQPFSITTFVGATNGGPLIAGHLHQRPSVYGGLNFGWDYDHYWGIEKRLGFGGLNLADGADQPVPRTGLSVTGEYRVMFYPLGDARWRPFLTAGVGWSDFYFNDDHGASHLDTVGMIPFGLGVKYLHHDRLAFRVDLIDEFTIGSGYLSNFHYVALTAGLEFRYGRRLLHMPWRHKDS